MRHRKIYDEREKREERRGEEKKQDLNACGHTLSVSQGYGCSHEESNLDYELRKLAFYPLNYGSVSAPLYRTASLISKFSIYQKYSSNGFACLEQTQYSMRERAYR